MKPMFKRKNRDKNPILDQLAWLEALDYKKQQWALDVLHEGALEILALACAKKYQDDVHSFRDTESNILHHLLYARCAKLNNGGSHTPETMARYVELNDHVVAELRKAVAEGKKLAALFENSQKEPGVFFTDFDIEVSIKPYFLENDGMNALLMNTLPKFTYHLEELIEKNMLMFIDNLEHTHWSISDILRISDFNVDLIVTHRHFGKTGV
jgi:hypothetical protein